MISTFWCCVRRYVNICCDSQDVYTRQLKKSKIVVGISIHNISLLLLMSVRYCRPAVTVRYCRRSSRILISCFTETLARAIQTDSYLRPHNLCSTMLLVGLK